MSAETHPPTVRSDALSAAPRRLAVAATIVAPLVFLVGQVLLPTLPRDFAGAFAGMMESGDRLLLSRLLTSVGAYLFVVAAGPLWWLGGRVLRGGTVIRAGAALFAIGTFFNGLSQTVRGYAEEAAIAAGATAGADVYSRVGESAAGLPIAYWSIPVFALGMLVVAAGLLIARLPLWIPVLLIAGVVLSLVTAGSGPTVVLGLGPVAVGFFAVALQTVRRGYLDPVARTSPVGQPG